MRRRMRSRLAATRSKAAPRVVSRSACAWNNFITSAATFMSVPSDGPGELPERGYSIITAELFSQVIVRETGEWPVCFSLCRKWKIVQHIETLNKTTLSSCVFCNYLLVKKSKNLRPEVPLRGDARAVFAPRPYAAPPGSRVHLRLATVSRSTSQPERLVVQDAAGDDGRVVLDERRCRPHAGYAARLERNGGNHVRAKLRDRMGQGAVARKPE